MKVLQLSAKNVTNWLRGGDQDIYAGDLAPPEQTGNIGIGFAHYGRGTSMDWTTAYDEALIVLSGKLTIRPKGEDAVSAGPGETIFVPKGMTFTYEGTEDTDMVYVTYPHVVEATTEAGLSDLFDNFRDAGDDRPAAAAPGAQE